ncbi:putative PB1 domain-containing protein [Tanacetum coccineum]
MGGDTRLITLTLYHNKTTTLQNLIKKILKTTSFDATSSFLIKYQLPTEDLDSLVSVSTDEDVQYMIEEYYYFNNLNSENRLRLFLFPRNSDSVMESVKSIGSLLLEGSEKSEEIFVKGLNGRLASCLSFCSDNSLLGLEDDVIKVNGDVNGEVIKEKEKKVVVQDVQSVPPESPEFGSVPDTPVKVEGEVKEEVNYVAVQAIQAPLVETVKEEANYVAVQAPMVEAKVPANGLGANGLGHRVSSAFDMASPDSVLRLDMMVKKVISSDGSLTNPLSRRNPPVTYQDAATQTQYSNNNNNGVNNDQNTRNQMQQQQIYDSAFLRPTSTAAVPTTTQTDLQHPQAHQQHQFIHTTDLSSVNDQNTRIHLQQQIHDSAAVTTAVPPPQYIHHHPSGAVPMASYYPIYPPQSQHHVPVSALDQRKIVYYMPVISAPPNSQVPTPTSLFTKPRTVQASSKPESPVYRTNSSGASGPQFVQVPSSQHHQPQPQYVAYSHIQQPSQAVASSGGSGGNYAYEFADQSQQGQRIYYAAQPMPPQSSAQYQTTSSTLPVEGGSHIQTENSMKQQVKTSQP